VNLILCLSNEATVKRPWEVTVGNSYRYKHTVMVCIYEHTFWWDEEEHLQNRKKSQDDNGAENLSCFKHLYE